MMKLYQDRDWIYQKYWGEKLSCQKTADLCEVQKACIRRWLVKFDIPRRDGKEALKGQVSWNKGLTAETDNRILAGENCGLWKGGKIKRICKHCGKEFEIYPCRIKRGEGIVCSLVCQHEIFKDGRFKGKNNPNYGKYPSKKIREKIGSANKGKKSPFNTRIEIECDYCGNKIIKKRILIKKHKNHFCNTKCAGKFLVEEIKAGNRKVDNFRDKQHTEKAKHKQGLASKGNKYALGFKHTEETKQKNREFSRKNWQDPEFVKKVLKAIERRPTNPEKALDEMTPVIVRYTGNRAWWRKLNDDKFHNPDFKITGQNKVIEIWDGYPGGEYWHKGQNPQELINLYAQAGLECLIFWEKEIYNQQEMILEKVNQFIEKRRIS